MERNFEIEEVVDRILVDYFNTLFDAVELAIPKVVGIAGMMMINADEACTGWVDQLLLETGEYVFLTYMYDYDEDYMEYFKELVALEECDVYAHYILLMSPFIERTGENSTLIVDNKRIHTIFYNDFMDAISNEEGIHNKLEGFNNISSKQKIAIFARLIASDLFNGNANFSNYFKNKYMEKCDKEIKMYVRECLGKNMIGFCCHYFEDEE